jgi:hypothetical protein
MKSGVELQNKWIFFIIKVTTSLKSLIELEGFVKKVLFQEQSRSYVSVYLILRNHTFSYDPFVVYH